MKGSAGFGQPKPLPGQAGYGEKVVDVLEKETNEMEARLQILQERLRAQQMTESDAKPGGSRWKSSKAEKGSIRSYGKEVSDKAKKKTMEISSGTALLSRSTTLPSKSNASVLNAQFAATVNPTIAFPPAENVVQSGLAKDVSEWTLDDVGDWLTNLGVPQYTEAFANNEMIGSMLLDITLEDLDYLNVKVLAHRKLILRAIEDLRQKSSVDHTNKAPAALMRGSSRGSARPIIEAEPVQVGAEVAPSRAEASKVHWSQLEPITSKQPPSGSQRPPVNAADEDMDEEAEKLAFQQAVEEWRRGGATTQKGKVVTIRQHQQSDIPSVSASAEFSDRAGEWVNPFALPSAPSPRTTGGTLKGGVLDEEAEHAEFVKAVEEWRNAKKSGSTNQEGIPAQTPRSVSVGGAPAPNTKQLADALASNMEKEKEEMFKNIQKRREDAEKRLQEAAKELEAVRLAKANSAKPPTAPDSSEGKHSDEEFYRSESKSNGPFVDRPKSGHDADVYVPQDIEFDDEDEDDGNDQLTTSVRIELVESIVGQSAIGVASSEEAGCVVEYASDSD